MAHPGKIIYSHPPHTDGVRFFYITFSRSTGLCELKGGLEGGENVVVSMQARELLAQLQGDDSQWGAEVTRRALRALHELIERRDL